MSSKFAKLIDYGCPCLGCGNVRYLVPLKWLFAYMYLIVACGLAYDDIDMNDELESLVWVLKFSQEGLRPYSVSTALVVSQG